MLATHLQQSIELKFQLTLEDYIAAKYLHRRSIRRLHRYLNICGTGLLLLLVAANLTSPAPWLGGATLGSILLLWSSYRFYRSSADALVENCHQELTQQKMLRAEQRITIFPTYIRIVSQHGGVSFDFVDFTGYKCDGDILLLYHSPMFYQILPRRYFATIEDFEMFISYLDAHQLRSLSSRLKAATNSSRVHS